MVHQSPSPKEQAFKILEQIQRLGFPNKDNIETLKKLSNDLVTLMPHFNAANQTAIQQLNEAIDKIEILLKEDHEIPIHMYTAFNKPLIILKTTLHISHEIPL